MECSALALSPDKGGFVRSGRFKAESLVFCLVFVSVGWLYVLFFKLGLSVVVVGAFVHHPSLVTVRSLAGRL